MSFFGGQVSIPQPQSTPPAASPIWGENLWTVTQASGFSWSNDDLTLNAGPGAKNIAIDTTATTAGNVGTNIIITITSTATVGFNELEIKMGTSLGYEVQDYIYADGTGTDLGGGVFEYVLTIDMSATLGDFNNINIFQNFNWFDFTITEVEFEVVPAGLIRTITVGEWFGPFGIHVVGYHPGGLALGSIDNSDVNGDELAILSIDMNSPNFNLFFKLEDQTLTVNDLISVDVEGVGLFVVADHLVMFSTNPGSQPKGEAVWDLALPLGGSSDWVDGAVRNVTILMA